MSLPHKKPLSLHTIPIETIYRILDNLSQLDILLSMQNVCTRFDAILNVYYRYQVNAFPFKANLFIVYVEIYRIKNQCSKGEQSKAQSFSKSVEEQYRKEQIHSSEIERERVFI